MPTLIGAFQQEEFLSMVLPKTSKDGKLNAN